MLVERWFLTPPHARGHEAARDHARGVGYGHVDRWYTRMLALSMGHRWAVVGVCVVAVASVYPLFKLSGVNFVPDEDESRFQISVRLPVGSSLAATQSLLDRVARDVREQLPGVSDTLAIAGFGGGGGQPNGGVVFVRLEPIGKRAHSQRRLVVRAREMMKPYRSSAIIGVQGSSGVGGGRGAGIQYALVGPELSKLDEYTTRGLELIEKSPVVVDADRGYLPGRPELRIEIDRKRAADLGVRVEDVSQTVNALMAGQKVTTYNAASDQYDVVLKANGAFRRAPESLAAATVRSSQGGRDAAGAPAAAALIPLRTLVTFIEGEAPASIDRLGRQRQISVSANWAPGSSQAEAQQAIQAAFAQVGMEPGYRLVASGQSQELGRAQYYFAIAFALSVVFMYMVLAAQFESFIHPVTILTTLPLAVPFGLLATLASGENLNIYSALGLLLLFGIVKKNAILQVDLTINLRNEGVPRDEAIVAANRTRLRPILMTTLSLVAGMMPLVFSSGPGAATNRSIGVLVAGGQLLCLLLTLLAVPVFYSLFDDGARSRAWRRWGERWRLATARVRRRRAPQRVAAPGEGLSR
ncbi:MAG: efflux RND transporter permease subunit [Acidobacteria bacterium]|nr:MAG: efflux RND transporter permease subunit [Acidobacteriota bacterium]